MLELFTKRNAQTWCMYLMVFTAISSNYSEFGND